MSGGYATNNASMMRIDVVVVIIGVIVIAIAIFYRLKNMALLKTVTTIHRGTRSERKLILRLLKHGIPPITTYHDLYLSKRANNQYAQIDAVVVTKVGIIVFEVKDYSGWIFGKGYQNYWTQVLAYGREKYRFYNPIMQNKGHIEALKWKLSGIADVPFYSVIIFYGRCALRDVSCIADGTYIGYSEDIIPIIRFITENNPPVEYQNKRAVVNILTEAVNNGNDTNVVNQHIRNIWCKYYE